MTEMPKACMTELAANSDHPGPVARLRDPATIRTRAHMLLELALDDRLDHFSVDMDKLDDIAGFVAGIIRENYPDLEIPYHSRWRHFAAGGYDRWADIRDDIDGDDREKSRAAIDLTLVSVLLDAGAGSAWRFFEDDTRGSFNRSEGLAIASFHMFTDGMFSSDKSHRLRVDADGLRNITSGRLAAGFQIAADNPMAGFDGRADLLQRLAFVLDRNERMFGEHPGRPGHLLDYLCSGMCEKVAGKAILGALLEGLAEIWPGRIELMGENLGDVWKHSKLRFDDETDQLMPFHKLSQWLTYSLLEPFEWAGIAVTGLDELTALAEYRNGGLFIDGGMLKPRDDAVLTTEHSPDEELIVEWRALTLALLDKLREPVAGKLGIKPEDFPLARMLEGGTWAAGRKLAFARDASGDPPIRIISDGTVF